MNFGKFVSNAGKKIGKLTMRSDSREMKMARKAFRHKTAEYTGHVIGGVGWGAKKMGQGAKYAIGGNIDHIKRLPKTAINMASPFVSKNKNSLLGYRLNPLGLGVAATISLGVGVGSGAREYVKHGMTGQSDGQTTPFAPRLPSYSFGQQAGATGDLVFALNNKRKG